MMLNITSTPGIPDIVHFCVLEMLPVFSKQSGVTTVIKVIKNYQAAN